MSNRIEDLIEKARHYENLWHEALDDNKRLKAEVNVLEGRVRYWRIEAECDHGRWLRCLEDLEKLRKNADISPSQSPHEIARLKAEVERLTEANDCLDKMHEKEMARSAYLCEEVNRTTAWGRGLESDLSHARVEISFLKAEVERLRKAGDAVCESPYLWETDPAVIAWRAAKEGKPSA